MYKVYNVMNGDTLDSIARKFNTDVMTLQRINEISMVSPGMSLIVPKINSNEYFTTYVVKKGDNLYELSKKYDVSIETIREINGLEKDDYLYPDQELLIPNSEVLLHVVNDGETLQDIARKFSVSPVDIIETNEKIYLLPEQLIVYQKKENF